MSRLIKCGCPRTPTGNLPSSFGAVGAAAWLMGLADGLVDDGLEPDAGGGDRAR